MGRLNRPGEISGRSGCAGIPYGSKCTQKVGQCLTYGPPTRQLSHLCALLPTTQEVHTSNPSNTPLQHYIPACNHARSLHHGPHPCPPQRS